MAVHDLILRCSELSDLQNEHKMQKITMQIALLRPPTSVEIHSIEISRGEEARVASYV
jgi:hypothetical protein